MVIDHQITSRHFVSVYKQNKPHQRQLMGRLVGSVTLIIRPKVGDFYLPQTISMPLFIHFLEVTTIAKYHLMHLLTNPFTTLNEVRASLTYSIS